jgi:hypothetical protein
MAVALGNPAALAVVALTAIGAALRFVGIGHQGFWFDEGNTALLVHFSPGKMIGLIPQTESTPPLYYCIAWAWARVFGYGEAGLRSLSGLAGTLTVPVVYGAARKLLSPRAGLIAAALTACNPFLIWYSQEARSYSLLVLLTALSLCAFAYVREQPTARRLVAWVAASVLALTTHYYAALAIGPEALWLLAIYRRERSVRFALAAVGACGLALIPLAISQSGTGHASWIGHIPLGLRLRQVVRQFLVGTGAPAQGLLFALGIAAVLLAVGLVTRSATDGERRAAKLAAGLTAAGVALELVLIAGGVDDMITRNVIVLWLPLALVVAIGLGARRAGLLGLGGAAALCAIGIVAALGVAIDRKLERPDWRGVARTIGPRPPAGAGADRAILVQHYRTLLPLSLYMSGLRYASKRGAVVNELDLVAISSPQQPACWWGAACNLIPSALPRSVPIAGFHVSGPVVHVYQFSVLRLRADRPVRLTPRLVSRALTTTKLRNDELLFQPPG